MLISFSKSEIPVIVVNPAAVKDHKISPLIRVYQPSQLGRRREALRSVPWPQMLAVVVYSHGIRSTKRDDNV